MGRLMTWPISISSRMAHQHESIAGLTFGLEEVQLKQKIIPGKWSAFEHVAHLGAYQPAFLARVEGILQEQEPEFGRYVAQQDPQFFRYLDEPWPRLLDKISDERKILAAKLSGIPGTGLARTGHHPKFGTMTLIQWAEFFLLHEAHHIYSIFMITRELVKTGRQ
jgi:hypothetical protein